MIGNFITTLKYSDRRPAANTSLLTMPLNNHPQAQQGGTAASIPLGAMRHDKKNFNGP